MFAHGPGRPGTVSRGEVKKEREWNTWGNASLAWWGMDATACTHNGRIDGMSTWSSARCDHAWRLSLGGPPTTQAIDPPVEFMMIIRRIRPSSYVVITVACYWVVASTDHLLIARCYSLLILFMGRRSSSNCRNEMCTDSTRLAHRCACHIELHAVGAWLRWPLREATFRLPFIINVFGAQRCGDGRSADKKLTAADLFYPFRPESRPWKLRERNRNFTND